MLFFFEDMHGALFLVGPDDLRGAGDAPSVGKQYLHTGFTPQHMQEVVRLSCCQVDLRLIGIGWYPGAMHNCVSVGELG